MAGAPLAGLVLAWLVIRHSAMLPMLIAQGAYSFLREGLTGRIVIGSILVAAALCVWITRLRDLVSLWVAVALLASLGDCLLVLLAGQRYSLGWYGGRLLSVVSSSVVLCALVYEFTWAYQRLLDANHELAHRVMHDGLTGAFNRVYFGEQFPRELRRAVRERAPMSVVMIDVDHFKTFNDACGHAAGDRCLIEVAAALQGAMRRPGDFVARYGGEEFVAVLPRTGAAGAMVTAEAMRHAVTRLGVSRGDGGGEVVTVSLGLATVDPAVEAVGPEVLVQAGGSGAVPGEAGGAEPGGGVCGDGAAGGGSFVKDASGSFLKKRTEKLFSLWVAGCFERAVDLENDCSGNESRCCHGPQESKFLLLLKKRLLSCWLRGRRFFRRGR